MDYLPLSEDQLRQAIDAQAVYTAWEDACKDRQEVRGSMFWRTDKGREYLVRANNKSKQTRLGARNEHTQAIYDRFTARKSAIESRIDQLEQALARHRRMNLALRVGRCPNILVAILSALEKQGVSEHFAVVGTHALYAYETAAGVRLQPQALATRDVDLLFDTRKRLSFFTQLASSELSFIELLRKADKTFIVKREQLQTAVNDQGFEVDVIRRNARDGEPHPLRLSAHEDDLWPVQVDSGEAMLGAGRFSHIVIATNGSMARMHTLAPATFVRIKRSLSLSPQRDPRKRSKDNLQADMVQQLVDNHLLIA